MLNKIIGKIKIFFHYLTYGMRAGDKLLTHSDSDNSVNDLGGVEEKQEENNVFKDVLRGEVTEAVKEARHEMYFSERKSHDYVYNGGGNAKQVEKKENNIEGGKVIVFQPNKQIVTNMESNGLIIDGKDVKINEERMNDLLKHNTIAEKVYLLHIGYNFVPRFNLSRFVSDIELVKTKENKYIATLFIPSYTQQFDNISKLAQKEFEGVFNGDAKSDILEIDHITFITKDASFIDDLNLITLTNFKFINSSKKNGQYRFSFYVDYNVEDLINRYYDQKTAEKNERHERRSKGTFDYVTEIEKQEKENYNTKEAEKVINAAAEKKNSKKKPNNKGEAKKKVNKKQQNKNS